MDQGEGVFINWTSSHASIYLLISKTLSHLHTHRLSLCFYANRMHCGSLSGIGWRAGKPANFYEQNSEWGKTVSATRRE